GELTDKNNNLSEFELNVTFDVQDENYSISQIAEIIRDELQRMMDTNE
ncbi:5522_t:CDS:1, partial [Paraglomus occultum]